MSEKNYDPQMHTAEHILNQTMVKMFGCSRSKNSHIERKKSKCDYQMPFEPTIEQIQEIEKSVNNVIALKLPVTDEEVAKDAASAFLDLSKLPSDAPELIRVVRVGHFDACACIGPHVENTSQVGEFCITSHSYSDGTLRLRFKLNRPC